MGHMHEGHNLWFFLFSITFLSASQIWELKNYPHKYFKLLTSSAIFVMPRVYIQTPFASIGKSRR